MHFPSRKKIILAFILIQLLVLPIILFAVKKQQETRSRADLSQDVEINTRKLLSDTGTETEQISISIQRKKQMLTLGKQNPDKFLLNVISDELKIALPIPAQDNIEKKVELEGIMFETIVEENASNEEIKKATDSVTFQEVDNEGESKKTYEVYPREDQAPDFEGRVRIKGYLIDNIIIPISIQNVDMPQTSLLNNNLTMNTSSVLGVNTTGIIKIAVVMVNFKNDDSDTINEFTKTNLYQVYFTHPDSVANYIKDNSFGKLTVQGDQSDVYGWLDLEGYTRKQVCDIWEKNPANKGFKKAINKMVRAEATALGKNFDDYDIIGYVFPSVKEESANSDSSNCHWNAIAKGLQGDSVAEPVHFLNGDYDDLNDYDHGALTSTSAIKFYSGILAHEVGHNLGLSHAHGILCGSRSIAAYSNCSIYNYGDRFDLMGGAWDYHSHTSGKNKVLEGWIPAVNMKTVTANGEYTLFTISKEVLEQTQVIKIHRPTDGGNYYLDYKTKTNGDGGAPSYVYEGATLRLSDEDLPPMNNERGRTQDEWRTKQSYLIDVDKRDSSARGGLVNPTFKDNLVFDDTRNDITIRQISHDANSVRLQIMLAPPPCVKESPRLIITEPSLSGDPGEKVRYEMKLTSNDSTTCPNATFDFTGEKPAGWTINFSQNGITVAPNQTITLYADVTSPASANTGGNPYIIQITAKNRANATFTRTKEARYNIEQTTITPTPSKTPTPTPTRILTPTPTRVTTPTPSPTRIPTNAPTPSPSPIAGDTFLRFSSLKLHGIGKGGDNVNSNGTGNNNPLTPTRSLTVELHNASGTLVTSAVGNITYASTTGDFSGTIKLPSTINSGNYLVKIKSSQFLRRQLPGIVNIVKGTTNQSSGVSSLVTGDINGDQKLTLLDFSIIKGCYSDLLPPKDCTPEKKAASDITNDGKVNQDDFSLYIRELSVIAGD